MRPIVQGSIRLPTIVNCLLRYRDSPLAIADTLVTLPTHRRITQHYLVVRISFPQGVGWIRGRQLPSTLPGLGHGRLAVPGPLATRSAVESDWLMTLEQFDIVLPGLNSR